MAITADQNLAPEQYPEMNRRFFANEHGPSGYLQQRLRALVLGASRDDRVREAMAEGLEWGTLKMGFPADGDIYEDTAIGQFVTLDATVLLHHAAESLMRLYFAVEALPPCPWVEVGRLREGAFKQRLRAFIAAVEQEPTRGNLLRASAGYRTFKELEAACATTGAAVPVTEEKWDKSGDAVALLMSHIAHVLVDDAPGYNAAKHGLAVLGGEAAARLGAGEVLDVSGSVPDLSGTARQGGRGWAEAMVRDHRVG